VRGFSRCLLLYYARTCGTVRQQNAPLQEGARRCLGASLWRQLRAARGEEEEEARWRALARARSEEEEGRGDWMYHSAACLACYPEKTPMREAWEEEMPLLLTGAARRRLFLRFAAACCMQPAAACLPDSATGGAVCILSPGLFAFKHFAGWKEGGEVAIVSLSASCIRALPGRAAFPGTSLPF